MQVVHYFRRATDVRMYKIRSTFRDKGESDEHAWWLAHWSIVRVRDVCSYLFFVGKGGLMDLIVHTTQEQCEMLFHVFAKFDGVDWIVPDWLSLLWLNSRSDE